MKIHTILALIVPLSLVMAQEPIDKERMNSLAKVTGQWGGGLSGLIWKRSVEDAVNAQKPLVVLHLFGRLDEEFC